MIYTVNTLKQLQCSCVEIMKGISSKEFFLLEGPLGIGKSTWIRFALTHLGYNKNIPSPSFSIHQTYNINTTSIHHIDLYRIKNDDELESFGFRDILKEPQGLIFIEWADRIQSTLIPNQWNRNFLKFYLENKERKLKVEKVNSINQKEPTS